MTSARVAVAVRGVDRSLSLSIPPGDRGTLATIAIMRALVHDAVERREFRRRVVALAPFTDGNGDFPDRFDAWLRAHFRFVRDAGGIEHIRQPARMLAEFESAGSIAGDCDDLATFAAAVLGVAGYRVAFITIAKQPGATFQHVHFAVSTPQGWRPYDPQERTPPGQWTRAGRRRIFPV